MEEKYPYNHALSLAVDIEVESLSSLEEITEISLYSRSSESCSAADRFWAFHQHSRLGYSWNLLRILLIRVSVQCFCKYKFFLPRWKVCFFAY